MRTPLVACILAAVTSFPAGQVDHQGTAPKARYGHGMVYDTRHQQVIMFGGKDSGGSFLRDTWHWDGANWDLLATDGPTPRAWFAMTYDVARRLTLLHGGRDSTGNPLNDTWSWDGEYWRRETVEGPSARDHHAMAYDPEHRVVLLFGGYDVGTRSSFDDTWVWDGGAWMRLELVEKPGPRDAHEMASDSTGRVVLYGGMNVHDGTTTVWGDTWIWEDRGWQVLLPEDANGRSHSALSLGPNRHTIRFGGGDPSRALTSGTWVLAAEGWNRIVIDGPSPRVDHAMAFDPSRSRTVLFGGYVPGDEAQVFGGTWEWDGKRWIRR